MRDYGISDYTCKWYVVDEGTQVLWQSAGRFAGWTWPVVCLRNAGSVGASGQAPPGEPSPEQWPAGWQKCPPGGQYESAWNQNGLLTLEVVECLECINTYFVMEFR